VTTVGIAELKASLSAFLVRVRAGETVLVTDHGHPVARIVPIAAVTDDPGRHLTKLARAGLVAVGDRRVPPEYWDLELPADPSGASLSAVLAEREGGW
jgi:prevent-host-death family protein